MPVPRRDSSGKTGKIDMERELQFVEGANLAPGDAQQQFRRQPFVEELERISLSIHASGHRKYQIRFGEQVSSRDPIIEHDRRFNHDSVCCVIRLRVPSK
jgi:hypothetical protein